MFAHDGRPFLEYSSRTWLLDDDGNRLRPARPRGRLVAARARSRATSRCCSPTRPGSSRSTSARSSFRKVELRTDVVARTETAKEVTALHRLYGIVEERPGVRDRHGGRRPAAAAAPVGPAVARGGPAHVGRAPEAGRRAARTSAGSQDRSAVERRDAGGPLGVGEQELRSGSPPSTYSRACSVVTSARRVEDPHAERRVPPVQRADPEREDEVVRQLGRLEREVLRTDVAEPQPSVVGPVGRRAHRLRDGRRTPVDREHLPRREAVGHGARCRAGAAADLEHAQVGAQRQRVDERREAGESRVVTGRTQLRG